MYKILGKQLNRKRRKIKIKSSITGTADRPRLSVFRSNSFTYCQLINDVTGETLVSVGDEVKGLHKGKNKTQAAFDVGKRLAEKALEKGIKMAVFDRSGYKYHGRVKGIAEGAREGGLKL